MNQDDFQALFQVLGDPETMWHYPYTFDGQHVRDWIERNMNRYRKDGRTCVLRNGTAGSEMAGLRPVTEDIKGEA